MILIIGHSANLTGAPKILLSFLQYFKSQTSEDIEIILRKGGPLVKHYREIGTTHVWEGEKNSTVTQKIMSRAFSGQRKKRIVSRFKSRKISMVFCNTITNGEILKSLSFLDCPIVTRVPELEFSIRKFNKEGGVTHTLQRSKRIIAVSQAVKDNLVNGHGVDADKVSISYGFIPKLPELKSEQSAIKIREELGVDQEAFLVGACGTLCWRKANDLFALVANEVLNKRSAKNIVFFWLGADKSTDNYQQFLRDLEQAGISDRVIVHKSVSDPSPYFGAMDLFLMTSREDPFPLVNMEAGIQKTPIICFDKSGGSPEFVTDDVGKSVPYLDVSAMADQVVGFEKDPEHWMKCAEAVAEKSKDYTREVLAPQMFEIVMEAVK